MSEQQKQISKLAGALTEHQHHFGAMSTDDRQWVIQNTVAAIALITEAVKNRAAKAVKKLLKFLRTISFPAIPKFVAAEKFREGETVDGIKVAQLGDNFKANFLTKVEESVPALEMREHELIARSRDPAIITELGGEGQVETFLAHFWEFLKTADQAHWHVRYVRDTHGVLWAVYGYWLVDGWDFVAFPLGDPFRWFAGCRVLSR